MQYRRQISAHQHLDSTVAKGDGLGKEADGIRELEKLGGATKQGIEQGNLGKNSALFRVLSQHPLARSGIPAVEQPDAVKVVQEKGERWDKVEE